MPELTTLELLIVLDWMEDRASAAIRRKPRDNIEYNLAKKLYDVFHKMYCDTQEGEAV